MRAESSVGLEESVVLLDEDGNSIGITPKRTVHDQDTPLHLAFSCYLFDADGRLLLTRRALSKPTWPGAWTNSCCGHPAPGEGMVDAVRRRVLDELGVRIDDVRLLLPRFRYRAVMPDGMVENEMCPVLVATTSDRLEPDPSEVEEYVWVEWESFRAEILAGTREISPWCAEQIVALPADPLSAPEQSPSTLPPAAHL